MAGTDTNKVTINVNGTNIEFTKIGNILGPAGKDGIDGKSIYAKTVDPWSVSGWNPAVAGDLFLNTTTGILWSAKASAVTSNVKNNWTKVGELAGKITVDSTLSSTSTNPVQNKVINDALGKKANVSHSHSSLTNSSGRVFNVPTGGSGGEQKTLVITDDLNAYQPAGNYASSTHKHPISDINNLQSTIDGIYTDMGLQDEAIAGKADSVHTHEISNINGLQSALNGKSNLDHNHDSVYQAKGDYATNDTLKSYVTGTTFINYTTYIEGEVNKKANASHDHDITDINGLQSALDGKSNTGHTHTISNITNLQSTIESIYSDMGLQDEAIAGKADSVHTHKISNINGLQNALDGKSVVGHNHTISDVAGLKTTLDGKANSSHTHSYLPLSGGTINAGGSKAPLILKGGASNWNEGLRIVPVGNWTTIMLGGNDIKETEGTSANSWSIHNNDGKFYISKNGSDYSPTKLSNTDGTWRVNDNTIIHSGNIGSQSVNYANSASSASYLSTVASVNGSNTSSYPWRRIMSIPATTANWYDTAGTYYLSGNYYGAPYYLFRVEFRTNNSSAGDPGGFYISVIATNSNPNDLAIASYSVATNGVTTNYSDIFVKNNYGWPRMTLTRLSAVDRGTIQYYNSDEGYNASSRTEAYIGINGSGTGYASYDLHSFAAYTSLIYGELTANVKYSNNAGWAKANDVYDWAKASSKPSYSWSEITSKPNILPYTPLNGGLTTVAYTTTWGVQTGSETASFADDTGGGLKFRKNCPSNGKMSMIIDGTVYVNEGNNKVIDTSNLSMSLSNGVLTITYNV